jgi:hypothetical protein
VAIDLQGVQLMAEDKHSKSRRIYGPDHDPTADEVLYRLPTEREAEEEDRPRAERRARVRRTLLGDVVAFAACFLDYEVLLRRDGRQVEPEIAEAFAPYVEAAAQLADRRRASANASADSRSDATAADWLIVREVAQILDVTPSRVRQLAADGEIGRRLGGRWVFTRDEIEDYMCEKEAA